MEIRATTPSAFAARVALPCPRRRFRRHPLALCVAAPTGLPRRPSAHPFGDRGGDGAGSGRPFASDTHLLFLGGGYTAVAVAAAAVAATPPGAAPPRLTVTTRSARRAATLAAAGVVPLLLNGHGESCPPALSAALATATHVLVTAPPPDPFLPWLLESHPTSAPPLSTPALLWAGVASSTSVYGDRGGGRVTEATVLNRTALPPTAARRLAGEEAWAAAAAIRGVRLDVFRLGGVYGPGRSALVSAAREDAAREGGENRRNGGSKGPAADQLLVNRVHVGDAAALILAAATAVAGTPPPAAGLSPPPPVVYNVVDRHPAPRAEVFAAARSLLSCPGVAAAIIASAAAGGAPRRRSVGSGPVGSRRARDRASKAVDGDWSYASLGVDRVYSGYEDGLSALAAGQAWPFGEGWLEAALG